jgi:hypothetical protein
MPDATTPGIGKEVPPEVVGRRGVRDFVIACTLFKSDFCHMSEEEEGHTHERCQQEQDNRLY